MSIQVAASELDIRAQVKRADGTWQRDRQVWALRYDQVVALGLRRSDFGLWQKSVYTPTSRKKELMHLPVYTLRERIIGVYIPVDTREASTRICRESVHVYACIYP